MLEEKGTSNLHLTQRRSERRILVHVPVEVTGVDREGRAVTEHSFIEDVSDMGCRFSTRGPVRQGDIVAMKILGPDGKPLPDETPRYYEIMWVAPKNQGAMVGARMLSEEKLANLKFPPHNHEPQQDKK